MGERIKRATRRFKKIFTKEKPKADPPKKMSASHVLRPEEAIASSGKRAPTTRRSKPISEKMRVRPVTDNVVHVMFVGRKFAMRTVVVRDPITRTLSRKQVGGGIKKSRGYYDDHGDLYLDTRTKW